MTIARRSVSRSDSQRHILRATSIIGGSSVVGILVGLARNKVAALLLGPAGIGLVGILHNLMQAAASFVSFGIGNVGTRQIASAGDDPLAIITVRRALTIAAVVLGAVGAVGLYALRLAVARTVLGRPDLAGAVGWLGLGVGMLVATYAQNGILTGLRRIGDLARVSLWSALLGTLLSIAVLLRWGKGGLLAFVLISPAITLAVGCFYVARLPRAEQVHVPLAKLVPQWRTLVTLGLAFTAAAIVNLSGLLATRSLIANRLGAEALGYFQASWVISMNYIGLILTAMAADYYPRLASVIDDHEQATRTVNHQAEIALLLAGPILVGTIGFAPWVVQLLYSSKFLPAVAMLHWQILADLLKIASWPTGFILLARGSGKAFVVTETIGAAVLSGTTLLLLPSMGVEASGVAFLASYAVYLPIVFLLARRSIGYRPSRAVIETFVAIALALAVTRIAAAASLFAGAGVGLALAIALGLFAVRRLSHALPAPIAALFRRLRIIAEMP